MNRALTSDREYTDNCLPLQRAKYKLLQLALVAAGYEATRYAVLEPACLTDRLETEYRKAKWVDFYLTALALKADLETIPNISECDLLSADSLTFSGAKASLTTALAGADNDIVWTSRSFGSSGNLLQVQYVNPGANNAVLAVTVVGTLIRISLATSGVGAITSTATLIRGAVAANADANSLIVGAIATGNTGAGVVIALAATSLTGGRN